MYYIERPNTWAAASRKCAEVQEYVGKFKNCLVADDLSLDALIEEIRRKGYWFSGENHQDGVFGMPIFEIDGRPVFFWVSWRYWGGLMAEAHTSEDNGYDYMDFYMEPYMDMERFRMPTVGKDIDETGRAIN